MFENRTYTYYYDNETLSANDVTTVPGTVYNTIASDGKTKIVGDIPGYTKTNKYRVFGDIDVMAKKTNRTRSKMVERLIRFFDENKGEKKDGKANGKTG